MSARDSESGSSNYKGGSGRAGGLGNGGIGGGMGGGFRGGGAGYNGGIGSRTGVTTGNNWKGTSAYGRSGGMAMGYGMSPAAARANAVRVVPTSGIVQNLIARAQRPQQVMPPQVMPPASMPPASVPPNYTVTDEMLPGYGQPYTPPQQMTLPSPQPAAPNVPPNMNNGVYGGWGSTAIAGGPGASRKFQDRIGGGPGVNARGILGGLSRGRAGR